MESVFAMVISLFGSKTLKKLSDALRQSLADDLHETW
jgi:hypothetical protein